MSSMRIQTISTSRADSERALAAFRMLEEPPAGLRALVEFGTTPDESLTVLVWESDDALGDFFEQRIMPQLESGLQLEGDPEMPEVIRVYIADA